MSLLFPLLLTTVAVRALVGLLLGRGIRRAEAWAGWRAAAAAGMAVVFVLTGVTHFVEPERSGLVAIVPGFVPEPGLAVTLSGIAEFVLAAALIWPRTRRWAAAGSVLLLLLLFPANVVAAGGVDHPAAPTTPLLPRVLLQLVFLSFSAAVLLPGRGTRRMGLPGGRAGRRPGAPDLPRRV